MHPRTLCAVINTELLGKRGAGGMCGPKSVAASEVVLAMAFLMRNGARTCTLRGLAF